jgi:chorismate mutase/prephenate dehydratase
MDLNNLRQEIDNLDTEILTLINKRMKIVHNVGEFKRKTGGAIYRPEREIEILTRLNKLSKNQSGLLTKDAIEAIFLEIFAVSRNLERAERVAYLGPEGSFTHQAAESRFGAISEYLPMHSIKDVVKAVEQKQAKFAVIPIENSSEGVVSETLDLLANTTLKIVAELSLPIHHSFVSQTEKLHKITKIYSKDIAFRQCQDFLNAHNLNNTQDVELIPVESTAKAAYLASQEENAGAICSHIASKLYNIPVLFDNIEDVSTNKTRFVILSDFETELSKRNKTSIIVELENSEKSGALYHFLKCFHDININLSRIQSRPLKTANIVKEGFNYVFYIDFDGDIRDEKIKEILEPYKNQIRWLGSYVKSE